MPTTSDPQSKPDSEIDDPFGCKVSAATFPPGIGESHRSRAELAAHLRHCLGETAQRLGKGIADVQLPGKPAGVLPRGAGHFHLAPELFIQLSGWTVFQFTQGDVRLEAGDVLLVPARVLHFEQVGADSDGQRFENLVVYAEDGALRCHLAQEVLSGVPGISHLEIVLHAQVVRIQEWLSGATLARSEKRQASSEAPAVSADAWAPVQSRALVMAALAAVLSVIDDRQDETSPEPVLVSRVRVMVQNQLGDSTLTVRQLAEQAGCTADYLSNLFSIATGEHLSSYINRLRVERAVHLLRESRLSGKEIAWACGFSSQSYFIRAFRAHFGQTPKVWRLANL